MALLKVVFSSRINPNADFKTEKTPEKILSGGFNQNKNQLYFNYQTLLRVLFRSEGTVLSLRQPTGFRQFRNSEPVRWPHWATGMPAMLGQGEYFSHPGKAAPAISKIINSIVKDVHLRSFLGRYFRYELIKKQKLNI